MNTGQRRTARPSPQAKARAPQRRQASGNRGRGAKRRVELVEVNWFPFGWFSEKPVKTKSARKSSGAKACPAGKKPAGGGRGSRGGGARQKAGPRLSFWRVGYWGAVAAIWALLAFGALIVFYSVTLPNPLIAGLEHSGRAVKVLAHDGSLIAERGLVKNHVRFGEIPASMKKAVIAIEDRRFYRHFGFDPIGFSRAMWANIRAGRLVQGGSTITQQLAKNLFLNSERTVSRKLQEMGMALWLETRFEKDQLLELYLNKVYFGHGAYGVDQAARRYFGKRVQALDLGEAAMLAGLLKAPSRLNPKRDYRAAKARAAVVLNAMVRAGYISPLTAKTAMLTPARLRKRRLPVNSNYIADWIADLVPEYISDFSSDLIVETTIDSHLQRGANRAVLAQLNANGRKRGVSQASMVVLSPEGAVRAMVGGRDYQRSQFNRAVNSQRQTGSVFKPFVYLTALEAGFEPDSQIYDQPTKFHNWRPRNYQNRYRGRISLRGALSHSSNVVAVKLLGSVGLENTIETARRLGLKGRFAKDLSLALGTTEQSLLDMTAAYAPFANGGRGVMPFVIRKIRTTDGRLLYKGRGMSLGQVVSAPHVNKMNEMLRAVVATGTGKQARIRTANGRHDYAGKTGTTQNSRDGWFIGYSAYYVTGVWVGNDNGRPMKQVTGGGMPARIWSDVMSGAHQGLAPLELMAHGNRPVERHGWRKVGLIKRIKPQFFEKVLD